MTFPASWTKKPVTCQYGDTLGGVPAGETVLFVAKQIVVVDGQVVVPKTQVATIGPDGSISIELPTTDDPALISGSGFAYTVYERFEGGRPPFAIFVAHAGSGVNLATVAPVVPPPELVSTRGPAGTIEIGEVVTLPAGSDATVENEGTDTEAVLDFGIPKGDTGAPGTTDYNNLQNLPTLGTAAATDASDYATAAQGAKADTAVQAASVGVANGIATLDASGTITLSQIPASLIGQVSYEGNWDASAGTPPSVAPEKGWYYIVTVAGTTDLDGITDWNIGDWAIYDGAEWGKVDNTDSVSMVAGLVGIITAAALRTALSINNLDNTSDANKPVSTAQATAIALKLDASKVGAASGAGSLDAGAQQPVTQRRRKLTALGNVSGAVTIDLAAADIYTATLIGATTLAFSNLPPAGYIADIEMRLSQDATGSRVVTWPASGKWPGGAAFVLTPAANSLDVVGASVNSAGAWIGYPVEAVA